MRTPSIMAMALACALPMAVATGCSGGGSSATGASASAAAVSGTVVFWDTTAPNGQSAASQAIVNSMAQAYPNVNVEYTSVPAAEAEAKFSAAAQAGEAPDVIRAEASWIPGFAAAGYLQPLDDTVLAEDQDEFLPAALASTKVIGQMWAVPQDVDAPALLCNDALLAKAGATVPTTWAQVAEQAPKVTAQGATMIYGPPSGLFALPYLYASGGDMLDTEGKKVLINDPPSVAGFQTALDLIASGAAVKPNLLDAYTDQQTQFKDGRVACIINGAWSVGDALSGTAFTDPTNLSVNLPPSGVDPGASPMEGHSLAVYGGAQDKEAAYAFVEHMNSQAAQVQLAQEAGLLPARADAYTQVESTTPTGRFVALFAPVVQVAQAQPTVPQLRQMYAPLDEQWIRMYSGQASAQDGANATAAAWLTILPTDYTD